MDNERKQKLEALLAKAKSGKLTPEDVAKEAERIRMEKATADSASKSLPSPADPSSILNTTPAIEKWNPLFRGYGATLKGKGHTENMDSLLNAPISGATGSLDGLGSYANGASQLVAPLLEAGLAKIPKEISEDKIKTEINDLIQEVNRKLIEENERKSSNALTTLVFAKAFTNEKGENKLLVANIGDSRVCVIRGRDLYFQTVDQKGSSEDNYKETLKFFIEKVKSVKGVREEEAKRMVLLTAQKLDDFDITNEIVEKELSKIGLNLDDWGANPREGFGFIQGVQSEDNRGVRMPVGSPIIEPQIDIVDIKPGDLVISFSDGVNGNFTNEELLKIISSNEVANIPEAVKKIMEARFNKKDPSYRRNKDDDVTLTVLEISSEKLEKIKFTNKDLLFLLRLNKTSELFTTGYIAISLDISHDLAFEILERYLRKEFIDEKGRSIGPVVVGSVVNTNAFDELEKYFIRTGKLDELFVLPPITTAIVPPAPTAPTIETNPKPTSLTSGEILDFILKRFESGKLTLIANDLKIKFGIDQILAEAIIDRFEREARIIKKSGNDYVFVEDLANQIKDIPRDVEFIKETPKPIPAATSTVPPIPTPTPSPTSEPEPTPEKTSLKSGHILDFILAQFKTGETILTPKKLQDEFNITKTLADKIIEKLDIEAKLIIKNGDSYTYNKENFEEQIKNIPREETIIEEDGPLPKGVNAEPTPEQLEEAVRRAESAKNSFFDFAKFKKYRYYIYALVAALGPLAAYQNYKSLSENGGRPEPLISAPAKNVKENKPMADDGVLKSANPTNEKSPSVKILNPEFEKTEWWMRLDPEVQINIKEILNSGGSKSYVLPFLQKIEILNSPGEIILSERTLSDLYDRINTYPNFINITYSDSPIQIPECVITAQDNVTKTTKTCYLRSNIAKIASKFRKIKLAFGENMYEPFPPNQTLSDSYVYMLTKITEEINRNAIKK